MIPRLFLVPSVTLAMLSLPRLAAAQEADAKPGEVTTPLRFKPGKGLQVESDDGEFALSLRLRAQYLYSVLDAPEEPAEHAFQVRRARIVFGGHVFGEHNKYKTELAFSPRDSAVNDEGSPTVTPLLDWYAELDHVRDANLRVGQYKVPFNRQRVISSGDLQLVDRSLAQAEFNLDRDVGAHVFSPDLLGLGRLRYYAGVWANQGRDAHEAGPVHPMYIARVEVLPFGAFADYSEGDLARSEKPGLSLGAAYASLDEAKNERGILGDPFPDGATADMRVFTADGLFKYAGLSLEGEFYFRRGDGDAALRDGNGWFLQGGYLLPTDAPFEIAARYSDVRPIGADSELSEAHELGGGASWYPGEHSLKLQGDYFRVWGADGIEEGATQVRVQLQMAY